MRDVSSVAEGEAETVAPSTRLAVRALAKSYRLGEDALPVLRAVDLEVGAREMVAIMGPSGSGKTTLLNCVSGIDRPDIGEVSISGEPVDFDDETALTLLRRHRIGMVFQFFNLIPTLTVRENVLLPFLIAGGVNRDKAVRADALLARVSLEARIGHYPAQLSGGEMQLVSVARALVHEPDLLLADEPTRNVNPGAGRSIMAVLRDTAKDQGARVLLVTHSPEHAAWADRIAFLKDGMIAAERVHGGDTGSVAAIYDQLVELGI